MEGYLAEIRGFGGNFAPRNWAYCQGQLISINSNQALFSLLGTTYGGDGRTTFALPDIRGRAPMSSGTGPGLTPRPLGQRSGTQYNNLTSNQLPSHFHSATWTQTYGHVNVGASTVDATEAEPSSTLRLGLADAGGNSAIYTSGAQDTVLAPGGSATVQGSVTVYPTGASQAVNNMQPYLVINWVICLQGIFPSRS